MKIQKPFQNNVFVYCFVSGIQITGRNFVQKSQQRVLRCMVHAIEIANVNYLCYMHTIEIENLPTLLSTKKNFVRLLTASFEEKDASKQQIQNPKLIR